MSSFEQPIPENSNTPSDTIHAQVGFEFHGRTAEYFKIWIVNLLLSIITLGIYSAWAKVRTKRYFYSNTQLEGSSFDYTAEPIQILKGRLLAVALLCAYQGISYLWPQFSSIAFLGLVILAPLVIVMSMRFRMRNTVWRGVRFGFDIELAKAYRLFMPPIVYFALLAALPFVLGVDLTVLEDPEANIDDPDVINTWKTYSIAVGSSAILAMLAFPWWQKNFYEYVGNASRYGQEKFSFIGFSSEFYGIYFAAFAISLGGFALAFALIFIISTTFSPLLEGSFLESAIPVLFVVIFMIPYAMAAAYIVTQRTNVVYSNLQLGKLCLNSQLSPKYMMWLYTTNTLAIVLSLGFAIPWAMIRVAHYRASTITLHTANLEAFSAKQMEDSNAVGEEVGEMFGFDMGL